MNELKKMILETDYEPHLDMYSIIYFAKSCKKMLYYPYFYADLDGFENYYLCVKNHLNKFISDNDTESFLESLIEIKALLDSDIEAIKDGDPVGPTKQEVILCYPGFEAICYYRISNILYKLGYKLIARIISEYAHRKTQIDIHPGATIGKRFSIDHGTGVVIGQTSIIGENVRIYQGVTLGAKWLNDASKMKGVKRHPTIENNVIIYANATILGGSTIIKEGSIIGANAFITASN